MKNRATIAGLSFFALTLSAGAEVVQESLEQDFLEVYGDTDMISIATGNLQSIAKAPAVASVIYAKDIEAMGATDLDQVLESIPGLHVNRHALGYNSIYVFRGIESSFNPQVLVLINGIPISNLYHGDRSLIWGGMPVKAINRVEVIRGPGSALYGADAFAGVINIVTLSAQDIEQNQLGAGVGSYSTKDAWGRFSHSWQQWHLGLVVEYHNTQGQDEVIESDLQSILDFLSGTQASHAPGSVSLARKNLDIRFDLSKGNWQFRAGLQQRKNWGNGAGVAEALDPQNRWSSDRYNMDLTYHNSQLTPFWDLQAQLSYFDTSIESENYMRVFPQGSDLTLIGFGGVFPDGLIGTPESFERHYRAMFTANYSGFEVHQIRLGVGYVLSDLYKVQEHKNFGIDPDTGLFLPPGAEVIDVSDTPYVYMTEGDRKNSYIFIQDVWSFTNDWELTGGIRYDHYSNFGHTVNPRLALVWSSTRQLTTKFLYGKAFRAPSFAETNAINNPILLGNPELDPEKLTSFELAFDYRFSEQLSFNLNLFHYDWRDIIKFTADVDSNTKSAKNVGSQDGRGLEFESHWQLNSDFQLEFNYAWQDSYEKDDGRADASQVPQQQYYLAGHWQLLPGVMVNTQLHWVMDRLREPSDSRPEIDDYTLLNLTLSYVSENGDWGADLRIANVADTDAREPSEWASPAAALPNDLPLAGRNVYVQFHRQF
ncbi:hypothetical protein tinsulaeT_30740 [Thalassotalea insulae]|uniref:TonB-dependent receptor n=1 Tax=Thalassotalea insulae TaxID=2056778 RepID=A0ABQ6GX16_9GAMM|nr:TonB-dependent receptor [Thalassotalea insulae]GLX79734.1 hypothetical protein tinsulaeT_30740 [Thalassotalea insulae]